MDSSPAPEQRRRNWLDMPWDVTASIMSRLVAVDIFTSVQFVCKAWLEITKDPLVWRKIDMSSEFHRDRDAEFEEMCRRAVDRSSGQLADVNIEYFGNDDLLKYITDRRNKIKRFRLACCNDVSTMGLIHALQKLPLLEDVDFTLCTFKGSPVIHAIGYFCQNIKSFRLNREPYKCSDMTPFWLDHCNREAYVIDLKMPELRHLQLIGNEMTNGGLEVILDGCSELVSLDLRRCLNIRMKGDVWKKCTRQIKHLRPPNGRLTDYNYSTKRIKVPRLEPFNRFFMVLLKQLVVKTTLCKLYDTVISLAESFGG